MFIIKNAWRSVTRNKGRNILIVIIVAIIAAAATIGLAIRNAAQTAREEGLASTTVTATIGVDRESMIEQAVGQGGAGDGDDDGTEPPDMEDMQSAITVDALTLDDYEYYADVTSVDVGTYYTEQVSLDGTDDFQPVQTTTSDTSDDDTSDSSDGTDTDGDSGDSGDSDGTDAADGMGGGPGGGGMTMSTGDFTITGFSSDTAVANASNGSFTMSDGEVFGYDESSDGDVIITQTLADFNGLEVGDTITLADTDDDTVTYELTIVGIYSNDSTQNISASGPMGGTGMDPDNAIYTSVSTLESLGLATGTTDGDATDDADDDSSDSTDSTDSAESAAQLTFTYVFASADDYETFAEEVEAAGLDDGYTVSSTDVEQYEASLVPLDNLSSFALTLLIIVFVVGAIVLVVINLFNVRERKYEVGVLLAIGIRKVKVAAQFVIELLIVTMIGIALGVVGGAVASVPVSNELLAQQISSQETQSENVQAQFGRDADIEGAPGGEAPDGEAPDMTDADDASGGSADDSTDADDAATQADGEAPDDAPGGLMGGLQQAVDYVDDIDATVNLAVVGQLVLIGLALTLISALVGIIAIIRYEPLQILADRS